MVNIIYTKKPIATAGPIYYISPTGSNSNNGSFATPWLTLYYACTQVTVAGSTIHIKPGTYVEANVCAVAPGVSIEGEGSVSVIKGHYSIPGSSTHTGATIALVSPTPNTNGNQSLSSFVLDGTAADGTTITGCRAISIKNRGNVKVFNMVIKNFFVGGINFHNNYIYTIPIPPIYDTGNELFNCEISNCGDTPGTWDGAALVLIACQADMIMHHNTFTETSRAAGHNGNIMNAGGRHHKNFKYYNNVSYKSDYEATAWNFHLEFWDIEGGMEIHDNEFYGGDCWLDLGGSRCIPNGYAYSAKVYNNFCRPNVGHGLPKSFHPRTAITVESYDTKDVEIYDNHFQNWPSIFSIEDEPTIACDVRRVTFRNNLCEGLGWGGGIYFVENYIQVQRVGNYMSDINILNNTFVSDNTGRNNCIGIDVGSKSGNTPIAGGTLENVNIKNNIICYNTNAGPLPIMNNGVINNLNISNNLCYNLANYNIFPIFWAFNNGTLTNYTYANNIPTSNTTQQNPMFVSTTDFHLQSISPCINTGANVGLPYTGAAPDIGAFEYTISGVSYYLSPSGNDTTGTGTIGSPWFTLTKAWTIVNPGDTIFMRGGTYAYNSVQNLIGKNGTSLNNITIQNYSGEQPIITKSGSYTTPSWPNALVRVTANYTYWKGLEFTGYTQVGGEVGHAFTIYNGNYNTMELINSHHNNHGMLIIENCTGNLVLNCDFHHNYDPDGTGGHTPYQDGDGIEIGNIPDGATNTIRGCRAWSNADDGFDNFRNDGFLLIENCWAWNNGYREDGVTAGGNGDGFKLGNTLTDHGSTHLRTITNCLSFYNRNAGFSPNGMLCVGWLYNNTGYYNAAGSGVYAFNFQFSEAVTTRPHILRNNIAHANQHPTSPQANYLNCITSNNTWNGGVTVTDADFISVNSTGVDGPRQAGGGLPILNFLKLTPGSDLINAGTNVGLPYNGAAPDLGAFETT